MPEWAMIILVTAVLAIVGWLLTWLINSLKDSLSSGFRKLESLVETLVAKIDKFNERLIKVESDCLKHKDLEDVVGPMAKEIQELKKSQSVLATSCAMRHSKDK